MRCALTRCPDRATTPCDRLPSRRRPARFAPARPPRPATCALRPACRGDAGHASRRRSRSRSPARRQTACVLLRHRPTRRRRIRPRARSAASRRRSAPRPSGRHRPRAGGPAQHHTRDCPRRHPLQRGAACPARIAPRPRFRPSAFQGQRGDLRRPAGVRRPAVSVPPVAAGPLRGQPALRARSWPPPAEPERWQPRCCARPIAAARRRPGPRPATGTRVRPQAGRAGNPANAARRDSARLPTACAIAARSQPVADRVREPLLAPRRHVSRPARVPPQSSPAAVRATRPRSADAAAVAAQGSAAPGPRAAGASLHGSPATQVARSPRARCRRRGRKADSHSAARRPSHRRNRCRR